MNEQTAQQLIQRARRITEQGRELSPEVVERLEAIAESALPIEVRLEAEILVGLEAMS